MKGWHFSTGRNRYDDGREIIAGVTHTVDGDLEMCAHGLHWSERVMDALKYAPGTVLARVDSDDSETLRDTDKCCSRSRRYLAVADVRVALVEIAARIAQSVAHLNTDPRVQAAIDATLKYADEPTKVNADAAYAARAAADAAADHEAIALQVLRRHHPELFGGKQ